MTDRVLAASVRGPRPFGLARPVGACGIIALGATLLTGSAEAATLYRSAQQTFAISDRYTADQQTILDPAIRQPTDQGFDVVEGKAEYSGVHRVALPGFDPALGTLRSVTVTIASEVTSNVGFSAAYLPDKPGGALFYSDFRFYTDLEGVPIAGGAPHGLLFCQASTVAGPCANTYKGTSNIIYAAALDPSAFLGPSAGVDLGYTLNSSWTGYVIGAPLTSLLNQLDWAGTVEVTYGNAAVPEPATWAMLVAGFAGVGSALRRQRRIALRA